MILPSAEQNNDDDHQPLQRPDDEAQDTVCGLRVPVDRVPPDHHPSYHDSPGVARLQEESQELPPDGRVQVASGLLTDCLCLFLHLLQHSSHLLPR